MSNRLEQEFPEVAWAAMLRIGRGGVPVEVMEAYMARGRALRSQAVRAGMRAAAAAIARGVLVAIDCRRRVSDDAPVRPPEPQRWPAPRPVFVQRRP
jgi:hypothetical protein